MSRVSSFALPEKKWWHDRNLLVAVGRHANEEGELTEEDEIFYFFEKPWKFEELYTAYDEWICAQGEAQDERNLSEP